ncbi:chaperonin [Culex quinquefasciatus]|uniref:Chaperonin n=1 Tax=Culex quinquefasciatus TaxID=7176 RepID=B0XCZ7_CULQU|nr:chaperonin [Culex quinquefasciatus]|eukprot:XP_001867519.1 chaperonin [Culex quinquefasciatus]
MANSIRSTSLAQEKGHGGSKGTQMNFKSKDAPRTWSGSTARQPTLKPEMAVLCATSLTDENVTVGHPAASRPAPESQRLPAGIFVGGSSVQGARDFRSAAHSTVNQPPPPLQPNGHDGIAGRGLDAKERLKLRGGTVKEDGTQEGRAPAAEAGLGYSTVKDYPQQRCMESFSKMSGGGLWIRIRSRIFLASQLYHLEMVQVQSVPAEPVQRELRTWVLELRLATCNHRHPNGGTHREGRRNRYRSDIINETERNLQDALHVTRTSCSNLVFSRVALTNKQIQIPYCAVAQAPSTIVDDV